MHPHAGAGSRQGGAAPLQVIMESMQATYWHLSLHLQLGTFTARAAWRFSSAGCRQGIKCALLQIWV